GRALALLLCRAPHAYLFFDLLAGLPKEEVGRDGRPQYCDEREQILAVERQVRDEGRAQDLAPVGPGEEGCADVREQREREPLEDVRDQTVRTPDLQRDDGDGDGDDQPDRGDWDDEV